MCKRQTLGVSQHNLGPDRLVGSFFNSTIFQGNLITLHQLNWNYNFFTWVGLVEIQYLDLGASQQHLNKFEQGFLPPKIMPISLLKNIIAGHESIKQTRNTKPSLRYGWWNLNSCFVTHPYFYKVSIDAKWFSEFLSSTVSPQTFSVLTTSAVSETAVPSNRIPSNNTGMACESMMVHAAVKAKSNLSQIKGRGQTSIDILPLQEVVHLQMVQVPHAPLLSSIPGMYHRKLEISNET